MDVADADALQRVVDGLWGPVRGVVHAAGVLDDALIRNVTAEQLARVVRPKVDGMRALERVTAGADLDLFVVYSSAVGTTGAVGQAAYAAANAWLDGRRAHLDRRGRRRHRDRGDVVPVPRGRRHARRLLARVDGGPRGGLRRARRPVGPRGDLPGR